MLSIRTPFVVEDIFASKELASGHPVYLLEGWAENGQVDSIVIKNESGVTRNVQLAGMLMNVVNPSAKQIPLNPQEMQALRSYAISQEVPDVESFRTVNAIEKALAQGGTWIKMEVKQLIDLKAAVAKSAQGNKDDIRFIAQSLKKSGGLEKLGEIIAADLFNGSNDRFAYPSVQGSATALPKMRGFRKNGDVNLRVLQNLGNVFVACTGNGNGAPVGLDNFDPNSQQRFWDGKDNQNNAMNVSKGVWGGHLLRSKNKAERLDFAEGVIGDLEALLGGPRKHKTTFRLGSRRKQRLLKGVDSGARKLKRAFVQWNRQARGQNLQMVQGVAMKLDALKWR